jgi:hypothetical protein
MPEIKALFSDEFVGYREHREDQISLVQGGILKRQVFVASAT